MNKFDDDFFEVLNENPKLYAKDFLNAREKAKNSNAYYHGEVVPFLLHPMFWSEEDISAFREIALMIAGITDKLTDLYLDNREIRELFGFPEALENLILREKGYASNAPIGRYDLFYNSPKDFWFCEINTDGSSAMNEDNELGGILKQSLALKNYEEHFNLKLESFELINSWVDKLLSYYEEWGGRKTPNVAICDFIESGTSAEFEVFKRAIENRGLSCVICDPRDTVFKNGKLFYKGERIDLLYRRIVTFELLEKIDEIPDFIKAYMNNAMCTVGEIRSQLIHHKKSFEVLEKLSLLNAFSKKERDFIGEHFPKTETLTDNKSLIQRVIEDKDKFVIKPYDKNASQGVFIGKDFKKADWELLVETYKGTGYLAQNFIEPYERLLTVFEGEKAKRRSFKTVVGLFLYGGKFQGLFTRGSEKLLISGIKDSVTLPNFLVREQ